MNNYLIKITKEGVKWRAILKTESRELVSFGNCVGDSLKNLAIEISKKSYE